MAARFCCVFVALVWHSLALNMNGLRANQPARPTVHLQLILGRALTDWDYRELLYLDLGKALEGYALTDQEVQALHGLSREKLNGLAAELQARLAQAQVEFDQRREIIKVISCCATHVSG